MMTKDELIKNPNDGTSHVVLLGAGASRAAFGDKLPLMCDLVDVVGFTQLLKENHVDLSSDFESIYSGLKNESLKKEIEDKIFKYFDSMSLPVTATIYDRLLLSLRSKDAIFTFNWDPFLFDAYQRNRDVVALPHIFFLHGNVRIGGCGTCDGWGERFGVCSICDKRYGVIPLLYPVEQKNYFEGNRYTAMSWRAARCWFADAFTITIFGYSAPESDLAAVELLKKAWLQESNRNFEHIELIDNKRDKGTDIFYDRWKQFTPTLHISSVGAFEDSRLSKYPRRSCEALFNSISKGLPCEDFPLPKTNNLDELQASIKEITSYE